jgi:hypothetical protein
VIGKSKSGHPWPHFVFVLVLEREDQKAAILGGTSQSTSSSFEGEW